MTRLTLAGAVKGAVVLAAVAGSLTLTACGSDSGSDSGGGAAAQEDHVASLVTASPSSESGGATGQPSKSPDPESKRPQLRLDSTAEEYAKYRLAYAKCLDEHGRPQTADGEYTPAQEKAEKAARKACANKEPLMPPEFSPETNPHYADDVRKEVACLKKNGFKVRITPATGSDPNAIGWTYESLPGEGVDIEKIQNQCRQEGFGGGAALGPGPA
ncbi:hypothetical protein Pth03_09230 [Planotetraspora thailandica]|uniref:PASTA domain-containing protein n=1 Tax=Planotetraspora thailandica TaxID=487172 RepID=A0A8J3XTU9_9ACTN|nr:hypothetical protein [Planotetraspora thailandica]GII52534.1 hypothetical protein Pth03_09230 [Planotetraspora thailandica]